ncbi:MAG TPA: hypothetical protein VGL24_03505, partial [Chthoniobacterales bacterium]
MRDNVLHDETTVAEASFDPTAEADDDGKTNAEEAILGTDPAIFNLISETHYSGYPEGPHSDSDPDVWTFYTQPLNGAPAEWTGLPIIAKIVFDSLNPVWNWCVDDYASINGQKFLDYGYNQLVYDLPWDPMNSNTFTATSNKRPQASCQPFKVVLVATPNVSIVPDTGVEGVLGGTVKGNKEVAGTKPFE